MNVKVEELENSEVKLEITVSAEKFEEGMNKAFFKNAKYFSVPGFRKGKAPRARVEKYYGEHVLYEDAFNEIAPEIYEEALKENNIEAVARPEIDITQIGNGKDLIFTAIVTVKPKVELGKYKGIKIEKKEYPVTDEDVDNAIKAMAEKNARIITCDDDKILEKGDTAVIDFEGFVGGEAFEGGKGENYSLEIGSNTFIPGFEDQLIGLKKGEETDVNVSFPENYFSKELAGKPATFKVKVNEIKTKEYPKMDDEFAKDVSEFDTLNELKADIKSKQEKQNEERAKAELEEKAVKEVSSISEVEIPNGMIEVELDNMEQDMDRRLAYQGITFEQYLQMLGKTKADFRTESKEPAIESIKMRLVLEAICKDSKIEASEEEINSKLQELADSYGRKLEDLKNNEDLIEHVKANITSEKAINLIIDNAKVKVVEPKEEKKATPKKSSKKASEKEETEVEKKTTKKSSKKAE